MYLRLLSAHNAAKAKYALEEEKQKTRKRSGGNG
jgi:hypothetical protein